MQTLLQMSSSWTFELQYVKQPTYFYLYLQSYQVNEYNIMYGVYLIFQTSSPCSPNENVFSRLVSYGVLFYQVEVSTV